MESNYTDLMPKINKNKNEEKSNPLDEQIEQIYQLNLLINQFNVSIEYNDMDKIMDIIKKMRIFHGKIIKKFFDTLQKQGKFNHEEFYHLSVYDTCYTISRNIIKEAEQIVSKSKMTKLKNIVSNDDNNKENDDNNKGIDDNNNYIKNTLDKNVKFNVNLPTFILFFEQWCGACKNFKPIWNEFKRVTNTKHVNIVESNDANAMNKYGIDGIPSVLYFNNNKAL